MESRTVTCERGKHNSSVLFLKFLLIVYLKICVSVTLIDRSGIHVNKQMFRSRLYFIDLSIQVMVIPWYFLLMLASALQKLQKSPQNKNAWQLDFYCLILIYKRHSISLRHENITADPCVVRMSPDTSRPHQIFPVCLPTLLTILCFHSAISVEGKH